MDLMPLYVLLNLQLLQVYYMMRVSPPFFHNALTIELNALLKSMKSKAASRFFDFTSH